LEEAEDAYREGKLTEAVSAVKRAEGLLSGERSNVELLERARRWRADLLMVARLDEIRLQRTVPREDDVYDHAGADQAFRETYRRYGLDIETLTPDAVAARIRGSAVRDHLVAALDDWWLTKTLGGLSGSERLLVVARTADPNPWRDRFRDAAQRGDHQALTQLAREKDFVDQPPATSLLLGLLLGWTGQKDLAVEILQGAQQRHPSDFWINTLLADCLTGSNPQELSDQLGFRRAAVAVCPENPMAHLTLGYSLLRAERAAEAESACHRAIALKPDFEWARKGFGDALERQSRLDEAETAYRKAIEVNSSFWQAHLALGNVLARRGRWAESAVALDENLRLFPVDHWSWYRVATLRLYRGDLEGYRQACREMLDRFGDSDRPDVAERIAKACSLAPDAHVDSERILNLADRAVSGTEGHEWYRHFLLAHIMARFRAGQDQEAADALRLFKPEPDGWRYDATAFAILAMVQNRLGHRDDARAALGRCRAIIADKRPDVAAGQVLDKDWHDWLQAELLWREANALLQSGEPGKPPE
jgi:eukaryotic-like serine/threonine-protein kinase